MNGRFVDIDEARVSVFDRGFLYGDGVFETMRSYAGVVFRLDAHLDRLFAALKVARIRPPYARRFLKETIRDVLDRNGLESAYIRLAVTRGEGRFGLNYSDVFKPNTVITAMEFGGYPDSMYLRGISAKVVEATVNEQSPVSGIKSLNFLNHILARLAAREDGFDEAILRNTKGHIAEGAASNIFLVKKGALITPSPDNGILPGITRRVVLGIAGRLRLKAREEPVSCEKLLSAGEVFLTNSLIEVLPVTKVNSKRIGNGSPGEVTKLLRISYQKQVIKEVTVVGHL